MFTERELFWIRLLGIVTACVLIGLAEGLTGGPTP